MPSSSYEAWHAWRRARLQGRAPGPLPPIPDQDEEGGFIAAGVKSSPGATGEALCHLVILGLTDSGPAAVAADWLEEARTPALAWLDSPDDVPGTVDSAAAGRVWATAAAACGLLAVGRDPGRRALDLLRGESAVDGRFTGGPYPTFAAAGAYWLAEGPKNEIAEWALRWAREVVHDLGLWEQVTGLTFWAAAGIPPDHLTVETFLDQVRAPAEDGVLAAGGDRQELELRMSEVIAVLGE